MPPPCADEKEVNITIALCRILSRTAPLVMSSILGSVIDCGEVKTTLNN
jgi:hypothetical protein